MTLDTYPLLKPRDKIWGGDTMFKIGNALRPSTETGLLIMTLTEQFPAAADADNTMITLPVDRMLQDEAAAEHTVAVQV